MKNEILLLKIAIIFAHLLGIAFIFFAAMCMEPLDEVANSYKAWSWPNVGLKALIGACAMGCGYYFAEILFSLYTFIKYT